MANREFRFRKKGGEIITGLFSADIITLKNEPYLLSSIHEITDLKRDEELKQIRLDLYDFSLNHSLEELLVRTLDFLGDMTNSPIGFYHFLAEDQKTLSLQAWSTRTRREYCRAQGNGLHYGLEEAGVWADCVREKRPVIHNDYSSLPHRRGLPEGHAPLIREIVIPVFRSDKIVAIIGIGNKPTDYNRLDVDTVSFLADVTWRITEWKRAMDTIVSKSAEMELILNNMINAFISLESVFDEKGELVSFRFSSFNEPFLRISELDSEAVLGRDVREIWPVRNRNGLTPLETWPLRENRPHWTCIMDPPGHGCTVMSIVQRILRRWYAFFLRTSPRLKTQRMY